MENRNTFKSVLERLHEAEQLLKMGIERGTLSSIERDIVLEKLRVSYEQLLFDKVHQPQNTPPPQTFSAKVEKIEVQPTPELVMPEPKTEIPPIAPAKPIAKPIVAETIPEKKVVQPVVEKPIIIEKEDYSFDINDTIDFSSNENSEIIEIDEDVKDELKVEDNHGSNGLLERPVSPTLGEKFQGTKTFRNELLGKGKMDVASVIKGKQIVDLTKAIGINDKFLFTKELFNGNAELYSKSINKLNEFTDINDALIFIQENFTWDDKNEAANQLIELVRRKLMYE